MVKPLNGLAVLFDLDGTLIDTAADLAAATNHVLVENGRAPVDPGAVRHLVGSGAKAMLRRGFELSAGETVDEAAPGAFLGMFLSYYTAHIAVHSRPFPGAVEALSTLTRAGARLAICTNKQERLARLLIDALGLQRFFQAIVGADTTIAAKPDPAPARFCVEKLGAKRAVFIGDSDTDIKTALAIGVPCFLHEKGYGPMDLSDRAEAVFSDYGGLHALIENAAG